VYSALGAQLSRSKSTERVTSVGFPAGRSLWVLKRADVPLFDFAQVLKHEPSFRLRI
jgi:hypothetical protein